MPNAKEINAVLAPTARARYTYAIKRIADLEEVWTIGDTSGFATYGNDNDNILFPVWPFEEYARLCCTDEFAGFSPEALELDQFLNEYLPSFQDRNYKLSVFPLASGKGPLVDIETFRSDLEEELKKY